ncbi:hypothetical protein EZV62_016723 [Acer yangbiense]|uniref:Tower domain-containing protein n=1 Tax=Acer yangbiense TaxID=1000413 RepID=A0A5C7HPY6_9ROSI|nr:hypothetical protein EZV62_016723 [Acer yangbiense]
MSTWQIFSDTDQNFRWETSGRILLPEHEQRNNGAPIESDSRLPSMSDLLLQGCSKLLENGNEVADNVPMFKTGLGKSVPLKQSSIAKALSVLRDADYDDDFLVTGKGHSRENGSGFSNSLFQTGSGKIVNISSSGLVRAKTLLGLEEDNDHCNFQGLQQKLSPSSPNEACGWQNLSRLGTKEGLDCNRIANVTPALMTPPIRKSGIGGSRFKKETNLNMMQSEMANPATKPPPIKFHTAGGRSLSVSSDALKYARSLLGDPELGTLFSEGDADESDLSYFKEGRSDDSSSNKENDVSTSVTNKQTAKSTTALKNFTSPLRSSSNQVMSRVNTENIAMADNLIKKFDAVDHDIVSELIGKVPSIQNPLSNMTCAPNTVPNNTLEDGNGLRIDSLGKSFGRPLADISNRTGATNANIRVNTCEKRKVWRNSVSPFKKPRSSKFSTPLKKNVSCHDGLSTSSSEHSGCKRTVSSRYPFQTPRMYVKEYFGIPPSSHGKLEHLQDQVRWMKSHNANKYMFRDESGLNCIGTEAFFLMLTQSGASSQFASKEWVSNHYKWIVWKLACYERCYSTKSARKFLTVDNVLEELKYRYEREVNNGHRSAIKRILEGDASPSSLMVLCISSFHKKCEPKIGTSPVASNGVESSNAAKVELTDGWYSVDALLDELLSEHLVAGKLFVGQKLRIWGAGLCGSVGPVSPLEASGSVSLLLNVNGTFRAHWADRLGFCKGVGAPLAFRCIKSNGGPVPRTLVGVTRIYPVLYKERLSNGGSVVRSERLENKMMQLYQHRRSIIVEGIASEFQRGNKGPNIFNDSDSEEGAKILKILETAAEPEVIMAEMSPEQLTSFATYQAKLEATRQSDIEKLIEKALEDAGLGERDVTPFMRVRVVGLTGKDYHGKDRSTEGIITIWNPTEKQQCEPVEGKAYAIAGLVPVNSDFNTLYLQARGSTTRWQPLSSLAVEHFKPFFCPRKAVLLSNLGEVSLSSEFDIAAYVVHVGEVYVDSHQKKQWVFVTDGSIPELQLQESSQSLLAINFSSRYMDDDSFLPINYNLVGSTVGFCNLIKRAKDQINHLWIAEATENSTYFLSFDVPQCSHLKSAAASAQRWAKISTMIIDKLKEKVLLITGKGQVVK